MLAGLPLPSSVDSPALCPELCCFLPGHHSHHPARLLVFWGIILQGLCGGGGVPVVCRAPWVWAQDYQVEKLPEHCFQEWGSKPGHRVTLGVTALSPPAPAGFQGCICKRKVVDRMPCPLRLCLLWRSAPGDSLPLRLTCWRTPTIRPQLQQRGAGCSLQIPGAWREPNLKMAWRESKLKNGEQWAGWGVGGPRGEHRPSQQAAVTVASVT